MAGKSNQSFWRRTGERLNGFFASRNAKTKVFDFEEARRQFYGHKTVLEKLVAADKGMEAYRQAVVDAADLYVKNTARKALKSISLNASGDFAKKKLWEHGYKSVADVVADRDSRYQYFLSSGQFDRIREEFKALLIKARKSVKFRFNYDARTQEATDVVCALARYIKSRETAKLCRYLLTEKQNEIEEACGSLKYGLGDARWYFASKAKRSASVEAFNKLKKLAQANYIIYAAKAIKEFKAVDSISVLDAWKEFLSDAAAYYSVLDQILPEREDDVAYGFESYDDEEEDDVEFSGRYDAPDGYGSGNSSGRQNTSNGYGGYGGGRSGDRYYIPNGNGSGNAARQSNSSGDDLLRSRGRYDIPSGNGDSKGRSQSRNYETSDKRPYKSPNELEPRSSKTYPETTPKRRENKVLANPDVVSDGRGAGPTEILSEKLLEKIKKHDLKLEGLKCHLRKYQTLGGKFAACQKRVLLGDEMGLGKTVQAIATMVDARNTGSSHFIVVCPLSVVENWMREIYKFSNLGAIKVHGDDRYAEFIRWRRVGGVAVTTYETIDKLDLKSAVKIDALVVDEAHYVKNPSAKRSQNVKYLTGRAERVLFMSGTPLENKVDEMISLVRMIQGDVAQKLLSETVLANSKRFREIVAPVYLRRKRKDVLTELPDMIQCDSWCELDDLEWEDYCTSLRHGTRHKVRRVSWTVTPFARSSKAKRLKEIVEEAKTEDRKVLVFSFYRETLSDIRRYLGPCCMEPISGDVSVRDRQRIIDEFSRAPAGSVLISQIQADGIGLNIQAASVVVICEPQCKPSTESQAVSRAYRMGQTRNVFVYRLLAKDTIDERMIEILERKENIFKAYADDSETADRQAAEIDEKAFSRLIEKELARIGSGGRRRR